MNIIQERTLEKLQERTGAGYKYFLGQKKATPDIAALETEKTQLLARIAEINKLLEIK